MDTYRVVGPRYGRFIGTGSVLGLVLAFVVARLAPVSPAYVWTDVLFYLGMVTVVVGGLIGGALALLWERLGRGRDESA